MDKTKGKDLRSDGYVNNMSRRKFLTTTGLVLAGTALNLKNSFASNYEAEPIIDIHQHTDYNGRNNDFLLSHQRSMGVTHTILLPAGRPVNLDSTHHGVSNGLQAKVTGNNITYRYAKKHSKEFFFGANEVPDLPHAVKEIEKYLKKGAVVIGELKFGVECDSPEMQKIYELAQHYDVPVLMHWQFDWYNYGFERFHTMLEKFPKVNFIGHAQGWWASIDKEYKNHNERYPKGKVTMGGITDRLLSDYPNMYGDLSAGSGLNFMTRDEDHGRNFLTRHQDKLMFGSDCSDSKGTLDLCEGAMIINEVRKLAGSKQIERKLLYNNAKKLFRI